MGPESPGHLAGQEWLTDAKHVGDYHWIPWEVTEFTMIPAFLPLELDNNNKGPCVLLRNAVTFILLAVQHTEMKMEMFY